MTPLSSSSCPLGSYATGCPSTLSSSSSSEFVVRDNLAMYYIFKVIVVRVRLVVVPCLHTPQRKRLAPWTAPAIYDCLHAKR